MKMNELWQWEERERGLQDKMGKYFYHRLDRLIKLKEQEQVNRDSSYLKEQKQDNRESSYIEEQDKEQEKDQVNRDSFYLKEQNQDNRQSSYIKEQFIVVFDKYTTQAPGAVTQSRE